MVLVEWVIIYVHTDKSRLFVFYGPDCIITVLHVPGPERAGMSGLGRSFGAKLWASLVDPMVWKMTRRYRNQMRIVVSSHECVTHLCAFVYTCILDQFLKRCLISPSPERTNHERPPESYRGFETLAQPGESSLNQITVMMASLQRENHGQD